VHQCLAAAFSPPAIHGIARLTVCPAFP